MTDDRRMTTDRFYGGVSDRLNHLRAMLEYIEAENPSRDKLAQWVVSNTRARSTDAVNHHLAFLQAIDIVDLSDGDCELDEYGQRYLDTGAAETLYEALSLGVKGFDTLLESLVANPMTDEEFMNLLVREFEEAEMETPDPAIRHREWLQVLGYVVRRDGVNQITQQGREILDSQSGAPKTGSVSPEPGDSIGQLLDESELPDGNETTERRAISIDRIIRDEAIVRKLKRLYDNTCQICGERRLQGQDEGFSHAHHLMPLGDPHDGPDIPENIVVICPNHHSDFEHGMLSIDPQTLVIDHSYESKLTGTRLQTEGGHDIGAQFLAYHNQTIVHQKS